MDGDLAPIGAICALAKNYGALTYWMKFTRSGSMARMRRRRRARRGDGEGRYHRGHACQGVGLMGGYITGSREIIDVVRSYAPGFIFTTSLAPALARGCSGQYPSF